MDWLPFSLTWSGVLMSVVVFAITFTISLAVVAVVLVKLPATYFCDHHPAAFGWADRHVVWRWTALLAKNLFGLVLVVLGLLLSLPGVPGQGILTILIGVMLLDFPGKRRLERWLVGRPRVFAAINGLRQRFGKPPLVLDAVSCAPHNPV